MANGYVIESQKYTTHVTGIPYSYDFYQGGANLGRIDGNGWKRNGTNGLDHDNQFYIAQNTSKLGFVVSPKFHIPANISTTTTLKHRAYDTASSGGSCKAYVGATSNQTTKVQTATYSIGISIDTGTGDMNTHKGDDKDVVLTTSNPYICISSSGIKTTFGVYKRHYLHAATIQYR